MGVQSIAIDRVDARPSTSIAHVSVLPPSPESACESGLALRRHTPVCGLGYFIRNSGVLHCIALHQATRQARRSSAHDLLITFHCLARVE